MAGPVSYFTSKLVSLTEYSLTPKPEDSTIPYALKTATIGVTKGLDYLVRLIEQVVGFLYEKGKQIYNSETFQTGKNFVVDKATIAKDYICEKAGQIYDKLSELQRPPVDRTALPV